MMRDRGRSRALLIVVSSLALTLLLALAMLTAESASARPYLPPRGHIFAGLTGGSSIDAYQQMVAKHPAVFEDFMTWDTPTGWLANPDSGFRSRLALHIGTSDGYGMPGVIAPAQIAAGQSDPFLVALNRNLAASGRVVYIRLMAEMNGYWNAYAAFSRDGLFRGTENAPRQYVAAWRRSVLILRGGGVGRIDRRLAALGLPRLQVRGLGARLPAPKVAFLWVPQDAGSPDIAANAPGAYFPGNAYVDWVGTDFYASYPNFALLSRFYDAHPGKPFVLSEWALYGADNPAFVRALFAWVRSHHRVRMLNYYQGFGAASKANLARYPASTRILRAELRSRLFTPYAREYAHPAHRRHRRKHGKQPRSPLPPLPPVPGVSPGPPGPSPHPNSGVCLFKLCVPVVGAGVPALP